MARAVDKGVKFNWHVVDWLSWKLRVGLVLRIYNDPIVKPFYT